MKTHRLLIVLTLLAIGACCSPARAQQQAEKNRLLIILDCSQSMWDRWQSDSKIKVTQHVLLRFLDSIQGQTDMEVALRVFGHLNNGDFGTSLEVPSNRTTSTNCAAKSKPSSPTGAAPPPRPSTAPLRTSQAATVFATSSSSSPTASTSATATSATWPAR